LNVTVDDVEEKFWPLVRFTPQVGPLGRPDSVNVTEYIVGAHEIVSDVFAPLTVMLPE
jgi:hypothetical protein